MKQCPICKEELKPHPDNIDIVYHCTRCKMAYTGVSLLINNGKHDEFILKHRNEIAQKGTDGNECPSCHRRMKAKVLHDFTGQPIVEVCSLCNYLFLPEKNIADIPDQPVIIPVDEQLSSETIAKSALLMKEMDDRIEGIDAVDYRKMTTKEKLLLWFFPQLVNPPKVKSIPIVSYVYITCLLFTFLFGNVIYELLNIASLPLWHPISIISDLFGNNRLMAAGSLYVFFVMGTRVEDAIGRKSYLLTIGISFAVYKLWWIFLGDSSTHMIDGASTIALTMMVFFTYLFPGCTIRILWIRFLQIRIMRLPVWFFSFAILLLYSFIIFWTGFSLKTAPISLFIAFIMPMLTILFIGGRKVIMKNAKMERTEEPYKI